MANEKRLIAENDVYELFDKNGIAKLHVADIDLLPRVDAVEVVRCKDCRYCIDTSASSTNIACSKGVNWRAVEPYDFCSYGERREA